MRLRIQLLAVLTATVALALSAAQLQAGDKRSQEMEPAPTAMPEEGEHLPYSERIVWNPSAPQQALFLPQSVLDAVPLEELPVTRVEIREAMKLAEEARRRHGPDHCLHQFHQQPAAEAGPTNAVQESVASSFTVVVGTVLDTVQGWNAWYGEPATLVYVRVEEILRDEQDSLRHGQLLAYLEDSGVVEVEGMEVCSSLPAEADLADPGERVLVTGGRYDEHDFFFSAASVLPVRGEKVMPLRWKSYFRNAEPTPLEAVRSAIRRKGDS